MDNAQEEYQRISALRAKVLRQRVAAQRAEIARGEDLATVNTPPNIGHLGFDEEVTIDDPSFVENLGRRMAQEGAESAGFLSDIVLGGVIKATDMLTPDENFDADSVDEEVDASRAYETILNKIGVRTDPVEPRTTGERLTHNIVAPAASGLGILSLARKTTGKVGKAIKENFGDYAKAEVGAAVAGGTIRTGAESVGVNPLVSTGLELVSNIMGGVTVDRAIATKRAIQNGKKIATDFLKKKTSDFSEAEHDAAATVIQGDLRNKGFDPREAADEVAETKNLPDAERITVGASTTNPALQSFEASVFKNNEAARLKYEKSGLDLEAFIHAEMRIAMGDPHALVEVLEAYRKSSVWLSGLVEQRIQQAVEEAVKVAQESPRFPGSEGEIGETIKQLLLGIGREVREIESKKWNNLELTDVTMRPLVEKLDEIMREAQKWDVRDGLTDFPDKSFRDQILEFVTVVDEAADDVPQILGANGKPLTPKVDKPPEIDPDAIVEASQIIVMRKALLERAALAGASKQPSKARRLYALADAALETLETGSTKFVEDLADAREYSFNLNERFTREVIGPLLSASARRGEVVAGNEVMERLFKPNQRGATNMKALVLAAGEMPEAAKAYIMRQFYKTFSSGEAFNTKNGQDFLDDFRPALDEAGMTPLIEANVKASAAIDVIMDEQTALREGIRDSEITRILEIGTTEQDIVGAIETMFTTRTGQGQRRVKQMFDEIEFNNGLSATEKRAATGGLRSAIVEGALKSFFNASGRIVAGIDDRILRVRNVLEKSGQYTEEQIERVVHLANLFSKQNKAGARTVFSGQSNTPQDIAQSRVMEKLMRLAFIKKIAPIFSKDAGPGSMSIHQQAGQMGADLGKKLGVNDAQTLINMAIFDADLMEALLRREVDMTAADYGIIARALRSVARVAIGIGKKLAPQPLRGSQVGILSHGAEEINDEQARGREITGAQ